MVDFGPAEKLCKHRPLLLAMEAVGWLHMLGKAHAEFLRGHGGQQTGYDYRRWDEREDPPFPWHDLLQWVSTSFGKVEGSPPCWPTDLAEFLTKHDRNDAGILGLLQAAHGMASGVEKNVSRTAGEYLGQGTPDVWLTSAFGAPVRNLVAHPPPEVLTLAGWHALVAEASKVLGDLQALGTAQGSAVEDWRDWRNGAIGVNSLIRKSLLSTLAETRLPNNDVTLWDQSYVAAALFKSAVAGAVLEDSGFPWEGIGRDQRERQRYLKNTTRWRLLTVGIGIDHYEARAVRIGDWIGAAAAIEDFFADVRQLVEVELAAGSLLYRDTSVCIFSFPGERADGAATDLQPAQWQHWIEGEVEAFAQNRRLETPPRCQISEPTRSLAPMVKEMRSTFDVLAVPVHKTWSIAAAGQSGHVCPVCLVRHNGSASDKQRPCDACRQRRQGRLDTWLGGKLGSDTIWLNELADADDRVALITLSLDLEPWLDGSRIDSLRTQAVNEWRRFNPTLQSQPNPIDATQPFTDLIAYVKGKLGTYDKQDRILRSLQEGYQYEDNWQTFFAKIVEDRSNAPRWDELDDEQRARWLVHQLFRKLPSPGRVYRFWRQAED
ncbi:MAG: CRISPR-associated protein Csx11, partial [Chloroflexi bacterium]|nr:CRISPR-associated protein Csx11 [Chloroflexota bacterium]